MDVGIGVNSGDSHRSYLISLHVAVLLLGMTGLFGKFLALSPLTIIAGRSLFTVLFLVVCLLVLKISFTAGRRRNQLALVASGILLSLHWFAFFHSIQLSTVAVGVIGFSTYPVFVTFLEPLLFRERIRRQDVFSGILVFVGLLCVVPEVDVTGTRVEALAWAVLSGAILAVFTILNRRLVRDNHFLVITLYQHGTATLVTLPFVAWFGWWPSLNETGLLLLLGVMFTAIPQALLVRGLKVVKAQLASVLVGLEPVYSIVFAMVLLNEFPPLQTLLGGGIVGLAVVLASQAHRGTDPVVLRQENT